MFLLLYSWSTTLLCDKINFIFFPVLVTLYSDLHMAKGKETAISQYQSPMKKVQTFAINFSFKSTVGQFF